MNYNEIGQRIRKYRHLRNISQETLAEKIDISVTHMSHIETGSTKLSLPVLVKIAETLQVSTDELLGVVIENNQINLIENLVKDCTSEELEIIIELIKSTKRTLDSFSIKSKK